MNERHGVAVDDTHQGTTAERGHQATVINLVGHRGASDRQGFGGDGNAARRCIAHAVAGSCRTGVESNGIRPTRHSCGGDQARRRGGGLHTEHIGQRGQGKHSAARGAAAQAQQAGAR